MSLNPFRSRSLLKNGTRGTATVLELDEKALRRHQIESTERVNLKLKLRVDVEGIEPYEPALAAGFAGSRSIWARRWRASSRA